VDPRKPSKQKGQSVCIAGFVLNSELLVILQVMSREFFSNPEGQTFAAEEAAPKPSRRGFLKILGLAGAGLAARGVMKRFEGADPSLESKQNSERREIWKNDYNINVVVDPELKGVFSAAQGQEGAALNVTGDGKKMDDREVSRAESYFHRSLTIFPPEVIATLGIKEFSILSGKTLKVQSSKRKFEPSSAEYRRREGNDAVRGLALAEKANFHLAIGSRVIEAFTKTPQCAAWLKKEGLRLFASEEERQRFSEGMGILYMELAANMGIQRADRKYEKLLSLLEFASNGLMSRDDKGDFWKNVYAFKHTTRGFWEKARKQMSTKSAAR
jgi:hypothetical protein